MALARFVRMLVGTMSNRATGAEAADGPHGGAQRHRRPFGRGLTWRLRACGLGLCGLLAGCSTTNPAGPRPGIAGGPRAVGSTCEGLAGRYVFNGTHVQDGVASPFKPGFNELLKGCSEESGCSHAVQDTSLGPPVQAELSGHAGRGLRIDLLDSRQRLVEAMVFAPAQLSCSGDALAVQVYEGMRSYGAGAWSMGRQTITVTLSRGPAGRLVARRDEQRRDVMLLVVPIFKTDSAWYVFEASGAAAARDAKGAKDAGTTRR